MLTFDTSKGDSQQDSDSPSNMTSSTPQWHSIPPSPSHATCNVYLIQAGGLTIPKDLVLLPKPETPNGSIDRKDTDIGETYYAPDYVFLVHHLPSDTQILFDLGIRPDLDSLPPYLKKNVLPSFPCWPKSPAELLKKWGTKEQQPENVKAVMFSHMHFDHVGDGAKAGFGSAEMWVGPTCCTYARPGYPVEKNAPTLSETLPSDGSRKIVEWRISDEKLKKIGDKRTGLVEKGKREGKYEGIILRDPDEEEKGEGKDGGWIKVGSFEHAFDVWGDGSAYVFDAPGHSAGHQHLLVRVQSSHSNASGGEWRPLGSIGASIVQRGFASELCAELYIDLMQEEREENCRRQRTKG